jgi:hypothetical protein
VKRLRLAPYQVIWTQSFPPRLRASLSGTKK